MLLHCTLHMRCCMHCILLGAANRHVRAPFVALPHSSQTDHTLDRRLTALHPPSRLQLADFGLSKTADTYNSASNRMFAQRSQSVPRSGDECSSDESGSDAESDGAVRDVGGPSKGSTTTATHTSGVGTASWVACAQALGCLCFMMCACISPVRACIPELSCVPR